MARGISVVITGSAAPLRKAIKDAEGQLGGFSKAAAASMAAGGAAVAVFATQAVKAAAADAQQQAILARTLQNTTGATNNQIAAVEKYIDATQRQVAFSDTELRDSLGILATATGDVSKAQALMGTVLDTATATQTDAVSVATALAKGYAGNTRALASLSPELKKLIKDWASFSDVLEVLEGNFKGAAATAAGTFQGRMDILRNSIDESKEAIGTALMPIVEKMVAAFTNVANIITNNVAAFGAIAAALGVFAGAIALVNIGLAAWRAAAAVTILINRALAVSFTTTQVAMGGLVVIVGVAAAAFMAMKGSTLEVADATNTYSQALYDNGKAQRKAIADLALMNPAFSKGLTLMTKLGYTTDDLSQFLSTGGKGALNDFAMSLFRAGNWGLDAEYKLGTLTPTFYNMAKAMNLTQKDLLAMSDVFTDLAQGSIDFNAAMKALSGMGIGTAGDGANTIAKKQEAAFKKLKQTLADAKKEIREYVKGISDAVAGTLSLSSAFSEAADSETAANDGIRTAVQERRDAYATLQQAQASGDAKAYADALDQVAKAEEKVRTAEAVKPKDYTAIFRQQVAAAKQFAGLLQQLIAGGNMSPEAIKQLLSLGPVAGAQVAKDLLAGTNGFTAASLSADLSDVAAAGTAAGMATPGFQEALNTNVTGKAGDYYITIQAGVSSPTDIAKTVTTVLNTYGATTGGVKVKVKRPKASTGRRK